MSLKLFGIEIIADKQIPNTPISMDVVSTDSSVVLNTAPNALGFESSINTLNIDASVREENDLINEYRSLALVPEVDMCVEEIVSEMIIFPKDGTKAIEIDLSNLDEKFYTKKIKDQIKNEYDVIYDLLMFNRKGHDIARKWIYDSRLNYFKNIDFENLQDGIQSLQFIDPRKIKKITESNKIIDKDTSKLVVNNYKEYFHYNDSATDKVSSQINNPYMGMQQKTSANIGILTRDSIAYVPSGLTDASGKMVIGYLHKALKVANNLKMMEDSMLIYRLARAPERRIFYIDTGNLPKAKAEQYVKNIADKYKSKTAYDVSTGKIRNDRAFLALTEDFWLARSNGSGTSIDTLPGGNNGGDTTEVDYFKNKLYDAIGVPKSRFDDPPPLFSAGTMVTRDEVRFSRLVERMRTNFNILFQELLGTQLILKNILSPDDWNEIKNKVSYIYAEDNYFKEQIRSEKLQQSASLLQMYDPFIGKYFSKEYFYKTIAGLTEDEIQDIQNQMKKESDTMNIKQLQDLSTEVQIAQMQQQLDAINNPEADPEQMQQSQQEWFDSELPVLTEDIIQLKFL